MSWILDFMMRWITPLKKPTKVFFFFFKRAASEAAGCLLVGGHKNLCINSNYRLGPAPGLGVRGHIHTSYKHK